MVLVKLFNLDPMEPILWKQENNTELPETEITEVVKVSGSDILLIFIEFYSISIISGYIIHFLLFRFLDILKNKF